MAIAFGDSWDASALSSLTKGGLPTLSILTGGELDALGANGAFSATTNTIYLSSKFLASSNLKTVTSVLLEEIGHFVDAKINQLDSAGDEGDIFQRLVQGKAISATELLGLKTENDHAVVTIGGIAVSIEMSKPQLGVFDGKLFQSVQGVDNRIYTRFSTDGNTWSAYNEAGGLTLSAPSIEAFKGRLYQSVRGVDNKIYTRSTLDGITWTDYQEFGGLTPSTPFLEALNDEILFQSVRGVDDKIYTRTTTDGVNWTAFVESGGLTTAAPDLEAFNGRMYQSVRGVDNRIYTRSTTDGLTWTDFAQTGGLTLSAPSLDVLDGKLLQAVRGVDNQIYFRTSTDGVNWGNFVATGSFTTSGPSVESFLDNGRVASRLSYQAADGRIFFRSIFADLTLGAEAEYGGLTPTVPE
jgi:hypothetical protein